MFKVVRVTSLATTQLEDSNQKKAQLMIPRDETQVDPESDDDDIELCHGFDMKEIPKPIMIKVQQFFGSKLFSDPFFISYITYSSLDEFHLSLQNALTLCVQYII